MTRSGAAALMLVATLAPACGKYGAPVRSAPRDDAAVGKPAPEEPAADPSDDDDAEERAREEARGE